MLRIILTGIIITVSMEACGIFDTRTPELPDTRRSTYIPPTTPDAAISNLNFSVLEKNSNNYYKCINTNNYTYSPDSKSGHIYGLIFQNWVPLSEKIYFDNLIAQTNEEASSNLFLSNKVTSLISSDSAIVTADYIFVFHHNRTNIPTSSTGNFRLTLKSDENSNFAIVKWEDFRIHDSDFTWSEFRANFSN